MKRKNRLTKATIILKVCSLYCCELLQVAAKVGKFLVSVSVELVENMTETTRAEARMFIKEFYLVIKEKN